VSGYDATNVGPYHLRVTETPATKVMASGTCAAPTVITPGAYSGTTLASDMDNSSATCTDTTTPDAVYQIDLANTADLSAYVTTTDVSYDLGVYITKSPCGSGQELACKDSVGGGGAELAVAKDLAPGTYFIFVDGFNMDDIGPYVLTVSTVDVLALGAACDP